MTRVHDRFNVLRRHSRARIASEALRGYATYSEVLVGELAKFFSSFFLMLKIELRLRN